MLKIDETLAKHLKTLEKHVRSSCKYMQHPDETLETYATCMYMQR
jgi:DNA anti-recombination protein RmuC